MELLPTGSPIYSHAIFIVVFTPSRFRSHYRYILLHPPTDCFPAEDYPSLSSPFTYALLLSYLKCKEHLFVTLLALFISLFSFFLFLFICFMPVSLVFFLLPHYGLFSNVSFLLFISLGKFSFHLSLIFFIDL